MVVAVLGAGAIGGVVAARLHQAGHEVALIARGAQLTALRERGVRVESPAGVQTVPVPVVGEPREIAWGTRDMVLLAVKSQHTQAALGGLRAAAPAETPVVCLQNGIANEPAALRLFPPVYGVSVACPPSYLSPGVVQEWSATVAGLLDVGRYPAGIDRTSEEVAAAFASAGFDARAVDDVRRWKHRKLLTNLGNAVEGVCGPPARHGALDELLQEGEAVLAAAGL